MKFIGLFVVCAIVLGVEGKAACPERRNCGVVPCQFGYQRDDNGCLTCDCNPTWPDCSDRIMCAMWCRFGFRAGEDGCPVCHCNRRFPTPQECGTVIMCAMHCDKGFRRNWYGCEICECVA